MPLRVQVYSDYVCPYCFLAEGPLQEAVKRMDGRVEVEWMPFELRPHPTPTLEPEGDYLQDGWAKSVYPMAEQMGVKIVLPSVSPQPYSRLAFEGSLFAREQGKADAWNHRMFTAFFQDDLDIGEIDVLATCAEEIGLNPDALRAALTGGTYHDVCGDLLSQSRAIGISSVPTFVLAERWGIPGMTDADTLVGAFERALSELDKLDANANDGDA
ncbi:MAG: DsbA family oxidoreductase [Alphaproteobacteria bacterium]|jgi:predicted DsbA family dithiol-disulfide isomerase|nr:DsbA family oxidoreductase [Alphaproteobacteria bacterium]